LIELLVVIAIIGILAAMVFPVFARARESARKAVCLSNVKNIALAIQMYVADNNDTLPPAENRQEIVDHWCVEAGTYANPYLRWPVILDEYVKNRDVWRCPSAKLEGGAGNINGDPDWYRAFLANEEAVTGDTFGGALCVYNSWWPSGWGGSVTDSFLQGPAYNAEQQVTVDKVFRLSIGCNGSNIGNQGVAASNYGRKLVSVQDPVNFIICGDANWKANGDYMEIGLAAYPEICQLGCSQTGFCNPADWELCPELSDPPNCPGIYIFAPNNGAFLSDRGLLKPYARHFGGNNFGFLDGHASWWNSERLLAEYAERAKAGERNPLGIFYMAPSRIPGLGCQCEDMGDLPTLF
jgi:prepilin-type processing-associated H-X9-DG protein